MPPRLSWKATTGRALATVRGGKRHGDIIYLIDDDKEPDEEPVIDYEDIIAALKPLKLTARERSAKTEELSKAIRKNIEPLDDKLAEIYHQLKPDTKKPLTEVKIDDGEFFILPVKGSGDGRERQIFFVAGPSGCGKSTFTAGIAEQYLKLHKDEERPIYLFSPLDDDAGSLDKKLGGKMRQILLNDDLVKHELDYKELANSLCIFDDVDALENGPIRRAVDKIRDQILKMGRHYNISAIVCSHLMADHVHTRVILSEAHVITFFSGAASPAQIKYVLERYCNASKEEIKKIKKLKSRSVSVFKNYPPVVLYKTGVYLLHQEDEDDEPTPVKRSIKKAVKDI